MSRSCLARWRKSKYTHITIERERKAKHCLKNELLCVFRSGSGASANWRGLRPADETSMQRGGARDREKSAKQKAKERKKKKIDIGRLSHSLPSRRFLSSSFTLRPSGLTQKKPIYISLTLTGGWPSTKSKINFLTPNNRREGFEVSLDDARCHCCCVRCSLLSFSLVCLFLKVVHPSCSVPRITHMQSVDFLFGCVVPFCRCAQNERKRGAKGKQPPASPFPSPCCARVLLFFLSFSSCSPPRHHRLPQK